MPTIKLNNDNPIKVLTVDIGGNTYNVPLSVSLKFKEARAIKTPDDVFDLFLKYIPEDVLGEVTIEEVNRLVQMWWDESQKLTGKKVGES